MKYLSFTIKMVVGLILVTMLAGCATPRTDWSARVGNYTFDQAVSELGPPDTQTKLSDGALVAKWLTRRGYRQVYPVGGYYYPHGPAGHYNWYPPTYVDTTSPDYFLVLTFNPDGQLRTWRELTR